MNLAFNCTKGYPGLVRRRSLPFQVEAALKYLVVPLTFAHDCTYLLCNNINSISNCTTQLQDHNQSISRDSESSDCDLENVTDGEIEIV